MGLPHSSLEMMQLRDHPIFVVPNLGSWWPPVWVSSGRDHSKTLNGEPGLLVETTIEASLPCRIFMRIEHQNERYLGALVVKDAVLCYQLNKLLQRHLGRTIKEIGDLD